MAPNTCRTTSIVLHLTTTLFMLLDRGVDSRHRKIDHAFSLQKHCFFYTSKGDTTSLLWVTLGFVLASTIIDKYLCKCWAIRTGCVCCGRLERVWRVYYMRHTCRAKLACKMIPKAFSSLPPANFSLKVRHTRIVEYTEDSRTSRPSTFTPS